MTLLAGCGTTDARLYVEQDGSFAPDVAEDSSSRPDAPMDVRDTSSPDVEQDVVEEPDAPLPDADASEPDAEPDVSGLEPACGEIDAELEFGVRILGEDHEEIIRVRSCGDFDAENLIIESVEIVNDDFITSDAEFELSGIPDLPFALLPNEAWPFPVRYTPTGPGEHTAVVRFTTNAPDAGIVDVQVTASVLE